MSFATLKKNRKSAIDNLLKAAEKAGGGEQKSYGDDRFWKPTRDKSGNGYAVVRFLPAPEGEDVPWIQYWDHGFKGPTGKWYIEKSLTTIGQTDPVSEYNSVLWNSTNDDDSPQRKQARDQKRRLHYVTNVLVISDPANPQNEGKVFLYEFGKKIFDKIMDKMNPDSQYEEPMNPFDFWEGADFKIKIRKVGGFVNYDASEFAAPSELVGGDETELEAIYNKTYSLQDIISPDKFKSYDELKAKLNQVLGEGAPMTTAESISLDETADYEPPVQRKAFEKPAAPEPAPAEEEDDTLSYFAKLAADS